MLNRRVLYFLLALIVAVLLAWIFSDIFSYLVISLALSTIFSPLTNYIHRFQFYGLHLPRLLAVALSFVIIIGVIFLFVLLFIPLIRDQSEIIANINYENLYARASVPLQQIEDFLRNNNITEKPPGFLVDDLRESLLGFITKVEFQDIINSLISFTGNFFVGTLAIVFITFILMYEKGIVRRQVIKLIPNQYFEVFIVAIYKIETLLSNYLIGLSFQVFAIFCIASLGLSILGIKYAFTIAIFAALANLIPYAGPVLGATFGIIVGLSTMVADGNTQQIVVLIIKILSVFATVQLADNLLLQPLIFSKSIKAHPLEIFIIIFVGATVAGVIGMIAAIPVYTILRVVTMELYTGYKQYRVFKS
ncbi:MAG: AI-2E family transporter [Bacteroidota bacterium]